MTDPYESVCNERPRSKTFVRLWETFAPFSPWRDPLAALFHRYAFGIGENFESRIRAAQFVHHLPPSVRRFESPHRMRDWAVEQANPDGLYLEFGVAGGGSTNQIAQNICKRGAGLRLYGFDSFAGLPENWRKGFGIGEFAQHDVPRVGENVTLVVGLFEKTLEPFLISHPQGVSFVHIDCDLYSSAKYVLATLLREERLRDGSVILFDELFNYPGWHVDGEYRALREHLPTKTLRYEFIAIAPLDNQAAIRLVGTR